MGSLTSVSRIFILAGIILVIIGILVNFGIGKLPGDIYIKKENFTFYFPIVSCIIISVIVSIVLFLLRK